MAFAPRYIVYGPYPELYPGSYLGPYPMTTYPLHDPVPYPPIDYNESPIQYVGPQAGQIWVPLAGPGS